MQLSDNQIIERIESHSIKIEPLNTIFINSATVDLRLKSDIIYYEKKFKLFGKLCKKQSDAKSFILKPKQFALASIFEKIELPDDISGRLEGKSSLARDGLLVHITAGYIDPGYKGSLTLELFNASNKDIELLNGMRIAQISFHELTSKCKKPYRGKYYDKIKTMESEK